MSFAQQHAWVYQQARPGSVANNLCLTLSATGHLDLDALKGAFDGVVARHEVLRTTYHDGEDGPCQRVHASLPPPVQVVDAEPERLAGLVEAAVATPFDLSREGPLKLWFVRHDDLSHTIILLVQHIVWDGMTLAAISADLRECYEALRTGRPCEAPVRHPQYADFAEWEQRTWGDREDVLDYWRKRLTPLPAPLALPYRAGAPDEPSDRGARVDRKLTSVRQEHLRDLARSHATSSFVVFLACYAEVLRARTGSDDIVVGTLAVDRDHPGIGGLAGNFGNPVAMRFELAGATEFGAVVGRVRAESEAAFVHRGAPFLPLADELAGHDGTGRVPFFDTMIVFVAQDIEGPDLPGVELAWERADNGAAQFPLVPLGLEVFVRSTGIDIQFTYSTDMFDQATVAALLDDLERTLSARVHSSR